MTKLQIRVNHEKEAVPDFQKRFTSRAIARYVEEPDEEENYPVFENHWRLFPDYTMLPSLLPSPDACKADANAKVTARRILSRVATGVLARQFMLHSYLIAPASKLTLFRRAMRTIDSFWQEGQNIPRTRKQNGFDDNAIIGQNGKESTLASSDSEGPDAERNERQTSTIERPVNRDIEGATTTSKNRKKARTSKTFRRLNIDSDADDHSPAQKKPKSKPTTDDDPEDDPEDPEDAPDDPEDGPKDAPEGTPEDDPQDDSDADRAQEIQVERPFYTPHDQQDDSGLDQEFSPSRSNVKQGAHQVEDQEDQRTQSSQQEQAERILVPGTAPLSQDSGIVGVNTYTNDSALVPLLVTQRQPVTFMEAYRERSSLGDRLHKEMWLKPPTMYGTSAFGYCRIFAVSTALRICSLLLCADLSNL